MRIDAEILAEFSADLQEQLSAVQAPSFQRAIRYDNIPPQWTGSLVMVEDENTDPQIVIYGVDPDTGERRVAERLTVLGALRYYTALSHGHVGTFEQVLESGAQDAPLNVIEQVVAALTQEGVAPREAARRDLSARDILGRAYSLLGIHVADPDAPQLDQIDAVRDERALLAHAEAQGVSPASIVLGD